MHAENRPHTPKPGFPGLRAMDAEECAAVVAALRRGALSRGPGLAEASEASACERLLETYTGRRHVLVVNSGTSALQAGLRALDVGPGTEVVVPAYGWLTNLTTVLELGARPVLAPVKADLTLDEERLAECFSPITRAVVAIHACGMPAALTGIRTSAARCGIPVLDDGSQALGATLPDGRVGSGTDLSTFSFQAFKVITCGEGGAVATDDEELYRRMVRYHDAGLLRFADGSKTDVEPLGLGFNLRLNELAAAVLRVQIEKLPRILKQLAQSHTRLCEEFEELATMGLSRVVESCPGTTPNHSFVLLQAGSAAAARRTQQVLVAAGYGVGIVAEDATHALPGWLRYLERSRFPYRVVDRAAIEAVLERILVLSVNWQRSEAERCQQRETLQRVVCALSTQPTSRSA